MPPTDPASRIPADSPLPELAALNWTRAGRPVECARRILAPRLAATGPAGQYPGSGVPSPSRRLAS